VADGDVALLKGGVGGRRLEVALQRPDDVAAQVADLLAKPPERRARVVLDAPLVVERAAEQVRERPGLRKTAERGAEIRGDRRDCEPVGAQPAGV